MHRATECCAGRQRACRGVALGGKVLRRAAPRECKLENDKLVTKRDPSSFLAFLEFLPDFPGLIWLWRGVSEMKTWAPRAGRHGFLPGGRLSSRAAERLLVGIFLLVYLFKALARLVLSRGPSYFTISSLQLDLRSWKLE
ncbi:hypothetical protein Tco_0300052 [Tanacetum coccineum]